MEKYIFQYGICLLCVLILSCAGANKGVSPELSGKTFYTQFNMWSDKGRVSYVNYSIERKIAVNTKVTIVSADSESVVFFENEIPEVHLTLLNIPKYSKVTIADLVNKYFAPNPVDLSAFTAAEQKFIEDFNGYYQPGISKEAVLIGRGYPPVHRTPSLKYDTWVYWRNKWVTKALGFKDNKTDTVNGQPIPAVAQ